MPTRNEYYSIEEEEEGWGPDTAGEFVVKYGPVIIIGVMWLLFRWQQPMLKPFGQWDTLFAVFLLMIPLYKASMMAFEHHSPKLISDPIHTSTTGEPIRFGIYSCFTIGDKNAWFLKERGKKGTIVVPTIGVKSLGPNIYLLPPLQMVQPDELPHMEREKILRCRDLHPPYWRGYLTTKMLEKEPDLNYLIEENKGLSRTNSHQKRLIDDVFRSAEDITAFKSRIQQLKDAIFKRSSRREEDY
jgi:hypothetical protein